jgi:tetratricopeptide (TPR) repeat protein
MIQRRPHPAAVLALFLTGACATADAAGVRDSSSLRRQAFELAYNLDHEAAVALLRQATKENPSDASAHRALASVLWLNMLFSRGAVTVDHYLGSFSRTQVELSKPPADLDAEFRRHVTQAIELADARTRSARGDPQAHYDLGAAVGLQASHIATVEGKMFAGFKAARRAYDEHEKVLELDGSRKDAGLVVGTYRYDRGIATLQQTAAADGEARTDALFALVLIFNRERRYDDALQALQQLRQLYPKNRLVVLEQGSTALRAGRAAQADAVLSEGLTALAREQRPKVPGEEALWRYKRGAARAALNRVEEARADLKAATSPTAQDWVRGRANVELARLAARTGDTGSARDLALQAQSLCEKGSDPACVGDARNVVRNPGGR